MRVTARPALLALLTLLACDPTDPEDTGPAPTPPIDDAPALEPTTPTTIEVEDTTIVTVTGLYDRQPYRVTLVVGDNVTAPGDGTGTFVDGNADGTADAGPSEEVALIVDVNGAAFVPGAKTVPGVNDDPANPSGMVPENGELRLVLEGKGPGTIYPVAYRNGGESTFLELDGAGVPVEVYAVGNSVTVEGDPPPVGPIIEPADAQTVAIDETYDYTVTGLDDTQAYRITLVYDANLTTGPDQTGTFIDEDANGDADAGPSETVAAIVQVNGTDVTPAKTVPEGTDDPEAPTGVFPTAGSIAIRISGVGAGTIYPVAYTNGGASTFLEIDAAGAPTEPYAVGGSLTVQ